jgi:glycosyltransferase involved in cell wall biosynthesis
MKVLHVHSGNVFGGIERTFVTLARLEHLCPEMHHHFALCFDGQLSEELRALNAPVASLGEVRIRNPLAVLIARHRLRRIIDSTKPTVIVSHAPWTQAALGPTIRSSNLPFVFWLHDAVEGRDGIERLAMRAPPDWTICNSSFTATKLPKLYPGCPSEVVYSPVDTEIPNTSRRTRASVRAEIGTPDGTIVIAMTSRLESWKGHTLLLDSLSKLNTPNEWECWIAGGVQRKKERAYLQLLERIVRRHTLVNRVKFLGQVRDIRSILDASDIHCQPNLGPEPFGIAFVEALNCGLPVVSTRMGAVPQIVDESCGILVAPDDSSAVAAALKLLIEDDTLRQRFSSSARARADLLCNAGRQIKKLQSSLKQAASQRGRRA